MFKVGMFKIHPEIPESMSLEAKAFILRCFEPDPDHRATALDLLTDEFLTVTSRKKKSKSSFTALSPGSVPYATSPLPVPVVVEDTSSNSSIIRLPASNLTPTFIFKPSVKCYSERGYQKGPSIPVENLRETTAPPSPDEKDSGFFMLRKDEESEAAALHHPGQETGTGGGKPDGEPSRRAEASLGLASGDPADRGVGGGSGRRKLRTRARRLPSPHGVDDRWSGPCGIPWLLRPRVARGGQASQAAETRGLGLTSWLRRYGADRDAIEKSNPTTLGLSDIKPQSLKYQGVEGSGGVHKQLQQDQPYRATDVIDSCVGDFDAVEERIIGPGVLHRAGATFLPGPGRVYTWKDCRLL
ncbi:mitogen-activated protein kinase kinase kinase 5 [Lates japonicus]|uniref:Mitogen-activated protein kinase kinase kinase 5 n=1 Tax=Lates japonicus TaxID=270547 RepID=A0AAD3NGI0_LATJO|nr:mitogen-activated protein kinase kinase kinase 5 [Lates japonicus]